MQHHKSMKKARKQIVKGLTVCRQSYKINQKMIKKLIDKWETAWYNTTNIERRFIMAYTKFGEFMRIQRIKHHEVMADTAKLFGVKLPFISTVESGKRNVPVEWIPLLIEHYSLSSVEQAELIDAVEHSKTQMKINLTAANNTQRRLAVQFQRSFENLDEDTAAAIIKLLGGEED